MDNLVGIKRGQAFNLACSAAIAAGKANDTKYIYQQYIYYLETAALLTSADPDDIKKALSEQG